jgi:hypothetical protein
MNMKLEGKHPLVSWSVLLQLAAIASGQHNPYDGTPGKLGPFGLNDGFESGQVVQTNHGGVWKECGELHHRWVCGHIQAQTETVRSGAYSARITLKPGDIPSRSPGEKTSERDELDSGKWGQYYQADAWFGWSFLLPVGFEHSDDRLVFGQWKQAGNTAGGLSPPLAQRYKNGTWYFSQRLESFAVNGTETVFPMPKLVLGKWHDLVVNVKFTTDETGYIGVWVNGTKYVDFKGRTAYKEAGAETVFYNKVGLYRDAYPTIWTMFFDNYEIGSSFASVDPATFSQRHAHDYSAHTILASTN